ncbi:MAG TPA: 16S rRNA (guanine(966)-N(2))-methyltransferase RsmD [Actinomycetota bacterium]
MRVTGGAHRGRRLQTTTARDLRPTTDLARRSIFDSLGDRVRGARVLDLFAGAGTLGIEALSRGASTVVFVERDARARDLIRRNLDALAMVETARIVRRDAESYLRGRAHAPFDLVFLDPPYGAGLGFVTLVLQRIADGGWVASGGTVVVEASVGEIQWPASFRETRIRRFGQTQVTVAEQDAGTTDGNLPRDV